MDINQRPPYKPTPSYPWQLITIIGNAKEQFLQNENLLALERKNSDDMREWQESTKDLREQEARGEKVHPLSWQSKDKILEEIKLKKSHLKLGKERLAYTIELTGQKLVAHFTDLLDDFANYYVSRQDYQTYLAQFKSLLETSDGLSFFSKDVFNKIQKKFRKSFLPNNPIIKIY